MAAKAEARRFWRSPQATAALIMIGAVALAFAAVRIITDTGDSDAGNAPSSAAPAPAEPGTTTPEIPAPAPQSPTDAAPSPTPVPGAGAPGAVPGAAAGGIATRTLRTQRFTIRTPTDWTQRASTGGLLLRPRGGGRVNVQIYFERAPQLSLALMSRQTAGFLRRQVPGASIFTQRTRVGGQPAYELTARGPGETAIAIDTLRGPYRYLLVRRIYAGARPQASRETALVVRSFSPR